MEINGPGRIETRIVRRAVKGAASTNTTLQVSGAGVVCGWVVAGPGPIGALDSILMLQGIDDSIDARSKGIVHGQQLLDRLDPVRDGLLAGSVPRATLCRLANAVRRHHDAFNDLKLQGVLAEIELRAHVELGKPEFMDKCVA